MLGGTYYQSFGGFLPKPNPTFLYNGVFFDVDNVLKQTLYSDPTNVNARILSFNCTSVVGAGSFNIKIVGTNEFNALVTETISIPGENSPVYSVNKYNTLIEMKQTGVYRNPVMQVGFAEGQTQFLAVNGGYTTHFVKIDTDAGATWSVWGFIPTTIVDGAQVTKLRAKPDTALYNKNASTADPVRVNKSFGYYWIETNSGQTQDVTWVVGVKMSVL